MPRGVYKRKSSKRDMILRAAGKIYAHHGFEGAKIDLIAEEAGVSKSLILEHFGNKQELVRAIADCAVEELLQQIREIDNTPGLTLKKRERLIHEMIQADRERLCLILGTVLVPSFQFQQREEITGYLAANCEAVLRHEDELREPSAQNARDYAYTAIGLHLSYVVGGNEDSYHSAMRRHLDEYLKEEQGGLS